MDLWKHIFRFVVKYEVMKSKYFLIWFQAVTVTRLDFSKRSYS
jgi:hypothetical protein